MTTRRYATADALKRALEARLAKETKQSGEKIQRLRQLVVFDRFLARLQEAFHGRVVVKGGVALELRLAHARATKDIDANVVGAVDRVADDLLTAAQADLGDWFQFILAPNREHPKIVGDGVRYGGVRFRGEARLGGTIYGSAFGVDVEIGPSIVGQPDLLETRPFLDFAGLAPTVVPAINRETHIAEKVHAYTQPRPRPNSRVKDLPDLALLAMTGPIEAARIRRAIRSVFSARGTHEVPGQLPSPSPDWAVPYSRIATQNQLQWSTLAAVTTAASQFIDPVLAGYDGMWSPLAWSWVAT